MNISIVYENRAPELIKIITGRKDVEVREREVNHKRILDIYRKDNNAQNKVYQS